MLIDVGCVDFSSEKGGSGRLSRKHWYACVDVRTGVCTCACVHMHALWGEDKNLRGHRKLEMIYLNLSN